MVPAIPENTAERNPCWSHPRHALLVGSFGEDLSSLSEAVPPGIEEDLPPHPSDCAVCVISAPAAMVLNKYIQDEQVDPTTIKAKKKKLPREYLSGSLADECK